MTAKKQVRRLDAATTDAATNAAEPHLTARSERGSRGEDGIEDEEDEMPMGPREAFGFAEITAGEKHSVSWFGAGMDGF